MTQPEAVLDVVTPAVAERLHAARVALREIHEALESDADVSYFDGRVAEAAYRAEDAVFEFLNAAAHYGGSVNAMTAMRTDETASYEHDPPEPEATAPTEYDARCVNCNQPPEAHQCRNLAGWWGSNEPRLMCPGWSTYYENGSPPPIDLADIRRRIADQREVDDTVVLALTDAIEAACDVADDAGTPVGPEAVSEVSTALVERLRNRLARFRPERQSATPNPPTEEPRPAGYEWPPECWRVLDPPPPERTGRLFYKIAGMTGPESWQEAAPPPSSFTAKAEALGGTVSAPLPPVPKCFSCGHPKTSHQTPTRILRACSWPSANTPCRCEGFEGPE